VELYLREAFIFLLSSIFKGQGYRLGTIIYPLLNKSLVKFQLIIIEGYFMNFQPLGKRVLVKRVEEANTTSSGIIIPDNAKEKPSRGEVVAVSKEVSELACTNQVLFKKYAGHEVLIGTEKYIVLELDDIFGIIG